MRNKIIYKKYQKEYQKRYRKIHKAKAKKYMHNYCLKHREQIKKRKQEYYQKNKNKIIQKTVKYYLTHKKECKQKMKNYYKNNKKNFLKQVKEYNRIHQAEKAKYMKDYGQKHKEQRRMYIKNKRKINSNFKIRCNLAIRIWDALKKNVKSKSTMKLLDCSIEQLKSHLESKFTKGMSFDNYGKWHIDHIRPCASFDLSKPEEQLKCFHYTNLQPLWAKDNLRKGRN
jgi:hypothetical protein